MISRTNSGSLCAVSSKPKVPRIAQLKSVKGYEITGGDVIKLGRVKFKVKEFWAEKGSYNEADEEACEEREMRDVNRAGS